MGSDKKIKDKLENEVEYWRHCKTICPGSVKHPKTTTAALETACKAIRKNLRWEPPVHTLANLSQRHAIEALGKGEFEKAASILRPWDLPEDEVGTGSNRYSCVYMGKVVATATCGHEFQEIEEAIRNAFFSSVMLEMLSNEMTDEETHPLVRLCNAFVSTEQGLSQEKHEHVARLPEPILSAYYSCVRASRIFLSMVEDTPGIHGSSYSESKKFLDVHGEASTTESDDDESDEGQGSEAKKRKVDTEQDDDVKDFCRALNKAEPMQALIESYLKNAIHDTCAPEYWRLMEQCAAATTATDAVWAKVSAKLALWRAGGEESLRANGCLTLADGTLAALKKVILAVEFSIVEAQGDTRALLSRLVGKCLSETDTDRHLWEGFLLAVERADKAEADAKNATAALEAVAAWKTGESVKQLLPLLMALATGTLKPSQSCALVEFRERLWNEASALVISNSGTTPGFLETTADLKDVFSSMAEIICMKEHDHQNMDTEEVDDRAVLGTNLCSMLVSAVELKEADKNWQFPADLDFASKSKLVVDAYKLRNAYIAAENAGADNIYAKGIRQHMTQFLTSFNKKLGNAGEELVADAMKTLQTKHEFGQKIAGGGDKVDLDWVVDHKAQASLTVDDEAFQAAITWLNKNCRHAACAKYVKETREARERTTCCRNSIETQL